jgi:hypothetical protein
MDLTLAATTAVESVLAGPVPGQALSNQTIGLWFVLLLILGVLMFLFWGE